MELVEDGDNRWRIPRSGGMLVDGLVFASRKLIEKASQDRALEQVAAVAHLPGIVGASIAMPDIHWGYGFPIGGVAATDVDAGGVVSPGGVGFDIGCGVRLLSTQLAISDLPEDGLEDLVLSLGRRIPAGVGGRGLRPVDEKECRQVLEEGACWAVGQGIGDEQDAALTEDHGRIPGADSARVSGRAVERGGRQLGSLGAGNHFVEVQVVEEVFGNAEAKVMGLYEGAVCIMIHSGSRGLGHQVCTEALRMIEREMNRLRIKVPDRQLACAPASGGAGEEYLGSMSAAGNFARCNRHILAEGVRACFEETFRSKARDLGIRTVYDVSHNLAKMEVHDVEGGRRTLCVHRKGATRAFGPDHDDVPEQYRRIGQPVLVPGSMGTASWVAAGTGDASALSFASTCHGAGRQMSRKAASKRRSGDQVKSELQERGILVAARQIRLLSEEAPYAYKDVDEVIDVCSKIGLSKKVAKMRPVAVVKG